MKNLPPFITCFCFLLFLTGCQKEDLPKPTTKGANTFGCKVNGEVWLPTRIGGPTPIEPVEGKYYSDYTFIVRANKVAGHTNERILIYLNNVTKPGTYSLNFDTAPYPHNLTPLNHGIYFTYDPNTFYSTTSQVGGSVTITRVDRVSKIISGTFNFTAVDKDGKQVKITNGRFDVRN